MKWHFFCLDENTSLISLFTVYSIYKIRTLGVIGYLICRKSAVFISYLNSHFWKIDFHCQFLPAVDIRVVGLLEGPLQLVKLVRGEGGPVPPVLLLVGVIVPVPVTVALPLPAILGPLVTISVPLCNMRHCLLECSSHW